MTKHEFRYYRTMELTPAHELSKADALARGSYNLACFEGGTLLHVEHHKGDAVDFVTYFRDRWPPPEPGEGQLFEEHARRYGNTPYRIIRRGRAPEGRVVEETFWYDARGNGTQSLESTLGDSLDPLRDVYRDAEGNITSIVEFDYDESGERLRERHLSPDDSLRFVEEYED